MSTSARSEKRTLGIVFLTIFLDLVGFGIIIPIQPFLAQKLGASPTIVTILGASFSLMQFIFAPIWGRLSDRIGRRPVMLASIAVACVGYFIFAIAETLPILFIARMLAGFGSANIGTAQAIIADSTSPEKRAKGMGLIGAAFGLGFIFGPAIGGFFGQMGLSAPAYVASGLCFLNWIFAFTMLPETRPKGAPGKSPHAALSLQALKHAARHPMVGQIFLLYFIFFLAFALMEQDLGLFIESIWASVPAAATGVKDFHAKHAAALTAYVLIVVGVTAAVVQGGLIGRLVKVFGEVKLLRFGTFLVGLTFVLIPLVGRIGLYGLMLVIGCMMATGSGLVHPSLSSLLSQAVDQDERGGALGLGQSLASLGRVFGPSVAGFLFELNPGVPFIIAGMITLFCTGIALTIRRLEPQHS